MSCMMSPEYRNLWLLCIFSILCKATANEAKPRKLCCKLHFFEQFIYCTFRLRYATKFWTHFCIKLITYTIGLLLSCVTPSFMPKALRSKPICGPFHNVHVFHRTSSSLGFLSLCSRDGGASSGTEK